MDDVALARAAHVLAVVLWIGGVALVTTVLLPAVRSVVPPAQRVSFFEAVERRFAWQARFTTLLAGLSGFHMLARLDLWERLADPLRGWWMYAMIGVWGVFSLMLFVAEPLFLHAWFLRQARLAPEATFARIQRLHWALLTVSLVTVLGAVAGSHGWGG